MTNRPSPAASYAGLVFVAVSTFAPWAALCAGGKLLKLLDDMKVNLPWPTWIALHGRTGLSALVLSIPVIALVVHRQERSQAVLGLLGILQLIIAAEYAFAVWLVARGIQYMTA